MKLTVAIKKSITGDWNKCFSELGIYKPMWLLRKIGPLVSGICLERSSGNDTYLPIFHVHNLAKPSEFMTLTLATRLRTVKTRAVDRIRVAFHQDHVIEAAERLRSQALIPLSGPVYLDDCVRAYRKYMSQPVWCYYYDLVEDIIILYIYCNKQECARKVLKEFEFKIRSWPKNVQPRAGIEVWAEQCGNWIEHPDQIMSCVTTQMELLKLQKIPHSELLLK